MNEALGESLPRCCPLHQKLHVTCPGIEAGTPLWEAVEYPPKPRHGLQVSCCTKAHNPK
jgi:hypothetical protein